MSNRRTQARMLVFGVVLLLISVALIFEPPGGVEGIGYAVVIVAILAAILRERRRSR
jgi:hypothetical protein